MNDTFCFALFLRSFYFCICSVKPIFFLFVMQSSGIKFNDIYCEEGLKSLKLIVSTFI